MNEWITNVSSGGMKSAADEKKQLRERFQAYRASLDGQEYGRLSHLIVKQALRVSEFRAARTVHVYWPIVERREIDTRPLVRWLKDRRVEVILPAVTSFEKELGAEPRLRHARFPGEEALRLNRWGIFEPPEQDDVSLKSIDVVIVPALGAGRNGCRVGHGFGYYDEFLARVDAARICLVYDACLVERVTAEAHDVPMHAVVTENEIIRMEL